ncbi:MAG: hypothetical protein H6818_18940 [Phycisphaerales bacterium]|nr:hypothetical protein [Phycisphaerales bacterium]MCB9863825.1 hypothetical protein [Phycisphaerales bacterium]
MTGSFVPSRERLLVAYMGVMTAMFTAASASAQINFTWQGDHNNNWANESNWSQTPGSGNVPNAANHYVLFNDSADRFNVDLNGDLRKVGSITVSTTNQNHAYRFFEGEIQVFGDISLSTSGLATTFDSDLTLQQSAAGTWNKDSGDMIFNGPLSGSGDVTLNSGTVRFNTACSYAGTFKINSGGQVILGNSGTLQNANVQVNTALGLVLGGGAGSVGVLSGSGSISIASGTLTFGGTNANSTYNGSITAISGPGPNLVKTGTGTQSLNGGVSQVRSLTVNGGAVNVGGGMTLNEPTSSGALILDGGDVNVLNGGSISLNAPGFNGGVLRINNGHILNISGGKVTCGQIITDSSGVIRLSDGTEPALVIGEVGGDGVSSTLVGTSEDAAAGPGTIRKVGDGTLTLNGDYHNTGGIDVEEGSIGGTGHVRGTTHVMTGASVKPGASAGVLTVEHAIFDAGSSLDIELGGAAIGTQHDLLYATGDVVLGGTLDLSYINNFTASMGDAFEILSAGSISGEFDTVNFPDGQQWVIQYDANSVTVSVPCLPDHVSTAQELIDAINCANRHPNTTTIYLDADITLTAVDNTDDDHGANGLPSVISPIVIEGQNHFIERDSNAPPFRIFRVGDMPTPGSLTIHDTTLRNGLLDTSVTSNRGGAAVLVVSAQLNLNNCILMDNNGNGNGGAILLSGTNAVTTLDTVVMNGNRAREGGAIYLGNGLLTVRNSICAGNMAQSNGSAITIVSASGQATITNTIISGNNGPNGITNKGTLTLVNCTLAGNHGGEGAGIYTSASGNSTVINSLIWGNAVATESQISCDGTMDVSYNGIEGGVAGITGAGTINDNGGNLNFSGSDSVFFDPVDPASAPTTEGNYHLAPDSVAIDEGSNALATNAGLTTDFEGDIRIVGMAVDLGADENSCLIDGDDDGDGVPDGCDLCPGFDDSMDADNDGVADGCDLCPGFDDNADIDDDGVPNGCDSDCSGFPVHVNTVQELIDAIHCANGQPDVNTIYLDADIILTAADNTDFNQGPNGLPNVISPIVIEGQNHIIERDTNAPFFRIFRVGEAPSPGSLTVRDTTLRNGLLDTSVTSNRGGAAVLVVSAQLTLNNCILMDNNGINDGGAILMTGGGATATLDTVVMTGNKAANSGEGGAIYLGSGQLTVRNSIFTGNQSQYNGSAISITSSLGEATITNTIISGNLGPNGITNKGTLTLVNSTLAGNHGGTGAGIYTSATGHSTVINSLIWGNAVATESQVDCDGTLDVSYTGIEGGVAGITGAGTINDNGGNQFFSDTDPVFVNPIDATNAPTTDGDYHLAADSVAIDQGSNTEATNAGLTTDIDGDARIIGGTVDLGADEVAACSGDGDDDGDGVCNSADICPGFDDNADADSDGVPDGCDVCPGFDDTVDTDNDSVPDGCDVCPNRRPGDMDGDHGVDQDDVMLFVQVLLDPNFGTPDERCAADNNLDTLVNGDDIQPFVERVLEP